MRRHPNHFAESDGSPWGYRWCSLDANPLLFSKSATKSAPRLRLSADLSTHVTKPPYDLADYRIAADRGSMGPTSHQWSKVLIRGNPRNYFSTLCTALITHWLSGRLGERPAAANYLKPKALDKDFLPAFGARIATTGRLAERAGANQRHV